MSAVQPPTLGYEAALQAWMRERGMECSCERYARPAAGGETLAWRLRPARAPRGVVVVAHGAGNDALYAMVGLVKRLLRRGLEVYTFDMDGHGRHSTTWLDAVAARGTVAEAAARALDGRADLPLHGVGVSLGGAFLLRTLADQPGRFASAALLVSPLHIEFSLGNVLAELGGAALRTLWRERHDYGLWGLVPSFGPVKRSVYPLRLRTPRPGAFGYVAALNEMLADLALEDAARRVRTRVLLVYGADDRLVPAAQARRLQRLLPAADLLVLPGETHLSTPMAPAAVARVVAHLGGRARAGRP